MSATLLDDSLMARLNGPPIGKWDTHEAAEAWYTGPQTGVRHVTKKRKVRVQVASHTRFLPSFTVEPCTLCNSHELKKT